MTDKEKMAKYNELQRIESNDREQRLKRARELANDFILKCAQEGVRVEDFIRACDYAKGIVGRQEISEATFRNYFDMSKKMEEYWTL